METFQFAIVLPADAESLDLLRELSTQMARAAGLDDRGARRAGDELVAAIEARTQNTGPPPQVSVSFERRQDAGPIDVEVTRAAPRGARGAPGSASDAPEVRRSWRPR